MFKLISRSVLIAVSATTALATGSAQACWFTDCFKCFHCCKPKPVTYAVAPACPPPAPVCPQPACEVCPQQVSYVQQTSFRTEYRCEPCTTYRPVTTCDPCTGCPTTVMQPVTTMVRRPVMVPFTTLRPVVTTAAPAVSGAAYSSPYYTGAAAPAPGCSSCGTGGAVAAPAMMTPAATQAFPAPSLSPTPSYNPSPMGSPTPATTPSSPTFQPNGTNGTSTPSGTNSLRPEYPAIPDMNHNHQNGPTTNPSSATPPRLLDPNNQTARRSLIGASAVPAIYQSTYAGATVKPVSANSDGWSQTPAPRDNWRPMAGR